MKVASLRMPGSGISLALALALLSGCQPKTIGEVMRKYRYVELTPPSTLVKPGTVVAVIQSSPFAAKVVCNQEASVGADADAGLDVSDSETTTLRSALSRTFKVDAELLNRIKANAEFRTVRNVELQLTNVQVKELSYAKAIELADRRAASCKQAIAFARQHNERPTLIQSVVIADVTYTVTTEDHVALSATALKDLIQNLGLTASLQSDGSSNSTVIGKQLIWGVRDDMNLVDAGGLKGREKPKSQPILPSGAKLKIVDK